MIKWYEKQLDVPFAEWGEEECEAVRAVLSDQKIKREKKTQTKTSQTPKNTRRKPVNKQSVS